MKYTDRISHYWPEFAKRGKQHITIEDVLRHDAGLCATHPPSEELAFRSVPKEISAYVEEFEQDFPTYSKR